MSNWQNVQFNTDLFSNMQKYLYTEQVAWLKAWLSKWNLKRESFYKGKGQVGILNLVKVAEEVLQGENQITKIK